MNELTRPDGTLRDLDGHTRTIPVGDEHVAIVDAADYHLVAGYRWRLLRGHNGKLYARASAGKTKSVYMHRIIAGTPDGLETDHENGNGLDNRRANLRPGTGSQNRANMGKPHRAGGHTSIFKGVAWDKSHQKWHAWITVSGRSRNLGGYDSEVDAARAYDAAALAAWGAFARLNFPREAAA